MAEALFRRGSFAAAAERMLMACALLNRPYPTSRLGLRLCIGWEALKQFMRPLQRPRQPSEEQIVSQDYGLILLRLPWIDFFLNQERFLYDVLLLVNWSQRSGFVPGIAVGVSTLGLILDLLQLPRIGRRYHQYAVMHASRSDIPMAVMTARFLSAHHLHHVAGDLAGALKGYDIAAQVGEDTKDISGLSIINFWIAWVYCVQGAIHKALQLCQSMVQRAEDAKDEFSVAYALCGTGHTLLYVGDAAQGIAHLQRAINLFAKAPAYYAMSHCYALQGQHYMATGQLREARVALQTARTLTEQTGAKDYMIGETYTVLAELDLLEAQHMDRKLAERLLDDARRTLRIATAKACLSREHQMRLARATGTYWWLKGNAKRATGSWMKSIHVAQQMQMPVETARTYLEIARYSKSPEAIAQAETLLRDTDAVAYRRQLDDIRARC